MPTRSRYPGVNSFKEGDHDIFCGRKKDTEELLRKIIINNTVVLHGESGKGKSSLVQAGLLHDLEQYNKELIENERRPYIPVVIKMDQVIRPKEGEAHDLLLVRFVAERIKKNEKVAKIIATDNIPFLNEHPDSLWYLSKQCERAGYTLLLILDQFEELQTYTTKQSDKLALALAEIFIFRMPQDIYNEFNKQINLSKLQHTDDKTMNDAQALQSDVLIFLEQPLSVRLLFVIREDKLGVMSLLNTHFPGILKNDYLLKPLTADGANMAISSPSHIDGEFSSPKFEITPAATVELLNRLYSKDTPGFYDPIELQIICSNIERKLGNKTKITENDLPKVENAIKEFYDDVWAKARSNASLNHDRLDRIKKKMIKELVVNGKRNLALKDTLTEKKEGSEEKDTDAEKVLQTLKAEGLVREIPGDKKATYFQLCHDRFIDAAAEDIQQAAEAKLLRKRRRIAFIILGTILLLIGAYSWFSIREKRRATSDERTWILMKMLQRRNNPTLAYVAGKDWSTDRPWADLVNNELATLDSNRGVFLKGIYPLTDVMVNVAIEKDSLLRLDGGDILYHLNTSSALFTDTGTNLTGLEYMGRMITAGKDILMYRQADSAAIIFKDHSGNRMGVFRNKKIDSFTDAEEVFVSPNLKYIYIEGTVYDIHTGVPVGTIPTSIAKYDPDKSEMKIETYADLSSVVFFRDDTLAAGYSDGNIRTYRITPSRKGKLPYIDTAWVKDVENDADYSLSSAEINNEGNKITAMTTDRTGRFLFVTTQFNSVLIYDFEKDKKIFPKEREDSTSKKSVSYAGEIKGHLSQIVSVSISPDNRFMLTGSNDHYLILWNITDPYNLEKVSDFRTPYGEKLVSSWLVSNNDIFTLSEDHNVYWWKTGRPGDLYRANQLYRFSSFVYKLNLLNDEKFKTTKKQETTKEQFKSLVNYLVSLPDENPFPADNMYNVLLKDALPEVNQMYHNLVSMPGYEKEVPVDNRLIMESLFIKMIYNRNDLPDIEKDIMSAKHRIPQFQKRTDSTTLTSRSTAPVTLPFFLLIANKYLYPGKDYSNAYTYLRYTTDSVLPVILPKLIPEHREYVQRQWDRFFVRYYIYSGKYDSAISLADTAIARYESRKVSFIYLKIAAKLAAGQVNEATALYKETELENGKYKRTLTDHLDDLLNRNIATDTIKRFLNDTGIQKDDKKRKDQNGD